MGLNHINIKRNMFSTSQLTSSSNDSSSSSPPVINKLIERSQEKFLTPPESPFTPESSSSSAIFQKNLINKRNQTKIMIPNVHDKSLMISDQSSSLMNSSEINNTTSWNIQKDHDDSVAKKLSYNETNDSAFSSESSLNISSFMVYQKSYFNITNRSSKEECRKFLISKEFSKK
jgi:hypothetical protein